MTVVSQFLLLLSLLAAYESGLTPWWAIGVTTALPPLSKARVHGVFGPAGSRYAAGRSAATAAPNGLPGSASSASPRGNHRAEPLINQCGLLQSL